MQQKKTICEKQIERRKSVRVCGCVSVSFLVIAVLGFIGFHFV